MYTQAKIIACKICKKLKDQTQILIEALYRRSNVFLYVTSQLHYCTCQNNDITIVVLCYTQATGCKKELGGGGDRGHSLVDFASRVVVKFTLIHI